ncbi:aminotransferase class I/II-fold pyridoxal phosphate-dependent enzyme [Nocardioides sp.]|uniref:MalY/PatB family protein n=1 Tax=Nocardioides sp. TaxID=35761 RepID=UPI001A220A19|nr:aminotransferase class I/II-fold pyridoxal phosphate-dependent enzyme [Nocardioides sp.]MBJ7358579.1 aminotransferase class I/II-fold pyridoxal phosphate-dependent enzyme [Nocardioides sp.]
MTSQIRDLSDDEARAALPLKWGMTEPGVIPAWVAEMDYALAEPVVAAVQEAVGRGTLGYPRFELGGGELGRAYAGFAARHLGHEVDPAQVVPTVDVTAGVRLALDVLGPDRSPMVLPLPAYAPQLGLAEVTGRQQWDLPVTPDGDAYVLDLDHLDRLFADGARTLLLTNPHNPCGHVHTRAELEGIRDLAVKHGARVISDEIHAPLVLPGADHVPYLTLDGAGAHAVAVVAASKAFNTAGLRCAQVVTADPATHQRLTQVPMARNDSWSPLGVVAAVAAYRDGDAWLAALVQRLTELRALLAGLLAEHLPEARMRPLEATYLAWLDLRAYGHADPAAVALRGGVRVAAGHDYQPGLTGHVRLNIATSAERLTEIVRRMGSALAGAA